MAPTPQSFTASGRYLSLPPSLLQSSFSYSPSSQPSRSSSDSTCTTSQLLLPPWILARRVPTPPSQLSSAILVPLAMNGLKYTSRCASWYAPPHETTVRSRAMTPAETTPARAATIASFSDGRCMMFVLLGVDRLLFPRKSTAMLGCPGQLDRTADRRQAMRFVDRPLDREILVAR